MGSTTEMVPHATRTSLNGANTCVPYVVKQSSKMCVRSPKKSWTQPLKSVSGRFHVPLKYRRLPCRQKIHPANGTYSTTGKTARRENLVEIDSKSEDNDRKRLGRHGDFRVV